MLAHPTMSSPKCSHCAVHRFARSVCSTMLPTCHPSAAANQPTGVVQYAKCPSVLTMCGPIRLRRFLRAVCPMYDWLNMFTPSPPKSLFPECRPATQKNSVRRCGHCGKPSSGRREYRNATPATGRHVAGRPRRLCVSCCKGLVQRGSPVCRAKPMAEDSETEGRACAAWWPGAPTYASASVAPAPSQNMAHAAPTLVRLELCRPLSDSKLSDRVARAPCAGRRQERTLPLEHGPSQNHARAPPLLVATSRLPLAFRRARPTPQWALASIAQVPLRCR